MESPNTTNKIHKAAQLDTQDSESTVGLQDKHKLDQSGKHPPETVQALNTQTPNPVEKNWDRLRLLPVGVLFIAFALWGVLGR